MLVHQAIATIRSIITAALSSSSELSSGWSTRLFVQLLPSLLRCLGVKGTTSGSADLTLLGLVKIVPDDQGVVLWRGWCGTLKMVVWYFEEGGMVLWKGRVFFLYIFSILEIWKSQKTIPIAYFGFDVFRIFDFTIIDHGNATQTRPNSSKLLSLHCGTIWCVSDMTVC